MTTILLRKLLVALLACLVTGAPAWGHGVEENELNLVGAFMAGDVLPLEADPLADAVVGEWASYYLTNFETGEPMGRLTHEVVELGEDHAVLEITFEPATGQGQPRVQRHRYPRGKSRLDPQVLTRLKSFDHQRHQEEKPDSTPETPTHRWEVQEATATATEIRLVNEEKPRATTRLHFKARFSVPYEHRTLEKTLRLDRWIEPSLPCLGWARVERIATMEVGHSDAEPYTEGYLGILDGWGMPEEEGADDGG